jgi:murein DD-endopeptidase MepM/ murein hydrolase activator NlpD
MKRKRSYMHLLTIMCLRFPQSITEYLKISSGFGMRMHPVLKKEMMHNGVDFSADTGTLIMSTANGTVRSAEYANAYGNRVIIDHGSGFSTSYNQMEKYIVEGGQKVKKVRSSAMWEVQVYLPGHTCTMKS